MVEPKNLSLLTFNQIKAEDDVTSHASPFKMSKK